MGTANCFSEDINIYWNSVRGGVGGVCVCVGAGGGWGLVNITCSVQ